MRKQLTDQQVEVFRERLLRAAEKLFAKHGVAGVSMRQIAQALGYSQTAAYRYFANKDEILLAMRAAALDRFCGHLEAAFDPARDARKNARAVGQAFLDFALKHPDTYRLIFFTENLEQAIAPQYSAIMTRFRATMTTYVQALLDAGYIEGDVETLAEAFFSAAHGIVMMHMSGLLKTVRARDDLHRASMRLIARGAGMSDVPQAAAKKPIRIAATGRATRKT
ncbi:MAG TPA: TetR family transcriptional regulator [Afipia sp.]|uniref:TetR/AcrR family transcriptional regulator n=1 Tax=unclassified Afipia TaxID=2642050 RepID=UPI00046584DF|nr:MULTISPECIES: TetR/AcrR family transcriptional regulator [unclassified Afipia]MAH69683.1 TetR family transcriptional regulator [Afipia sp.]OUX61098.1 MAG: TetR family transcriptional regulator [Afipia sp. TMED4]HAO39717.1 TetR family transcriptional regulator [Afipia sp.]HAP09480.1 TetR family transcriptional regulator [Afipia sp.]HAP47089.1 TetR family transcriptional regulator [Afipia sp.]